MKTFKITIKVIGLGGERITEHTVKAKTEKSAQAKGWQIIGNQSGEIVEIRAV